MNMILMLLLAGASAEVCLKGDMSNTNGQAVMAYWSNWPQYRIKGNTFPDSTCPGPAGGQRSESKGGRGGDRLGKEERAHAERARTD
jgi:hypothetical protein